ncbi:MAG: hypothetical protein LBM01_03725 [Christensenellaceae bacterium]|jgi:hypothetical protein|nr:hypothetical protein [Christensenellaceae bacterium]
MGRNKESKKSTLKTALKIGAVIIVPIIYELLVFCIAKLSLGTAWEEMYKLGLTPATAGDFLKDNFWTYMSLVLCRIAIYIIPALLFFAVSFIKRDKRYNVFKTFLKCLNLQFLGYLLYKGITIILGLDYLIGLEPFTNISMYMSIIGYIATLGRNKEIEFGKINDKGF